MLFPERAAEFKSEAAILFGGPRQRKGVSRVERFVAETDVEAAVPVLDPGLGEDVNAHERRFVILGGVSVGPESDLANLIFRRKLAATKSVDSERGAGAGQIAKRLLELLGVIGQLRNLLFGQNRRERVARIRAGFSFVASDRDLVLNAGHVEFDLDIVGARA